MKRRGYTIRRPNGRAIARVMIPGGRVRLGTHRQGTGRVVSLGFVIVTWWGMGSGDRRG